MARMRLDKYLAKCGLGTRTEVRGIIRAGAVAVDGKAAKDPSLNIESGIAAVTVDGSPLTYSEYHYFMLNKPAGVISATRDRLHSTVLDLMPPEYLHLDLFPVGRLDKDTEGLLLITDDGQLGHRLLSPRKHVPKTYRAIIDGPVDGKDIDQFARGIQLSDFTTLPARLEIVEAGPQCLVEITIYEGKFHQVKRMFHAVGKEVLHLKRIAMGSLLLDQDLAPGEIRQLRPAELDLLQDWR